MAYANLPAPSPEQGLSRYLSEIRKFPMLEPQEEYMLAKAWVDHGDTEAAHKMVTSHLRLAAKLAMGYRGYGLPTAEVISEANVGLMQAVKRFDPEKGFRLATYAMWWIRAAIQEYILRSWSLVKMGTTAAQKKLFFNLRKAKNKIGALEEGDLRPENVERIATDLGVTQAEVISMNRRLGGGGDASLNAQVSADGDGAAEWQDWLTDDDADQAANYAEQQEMDQRRDLLIQAMGALNERERHILTERKLKDEPVTLEGLSEVYGVSRERIRQIEARAFEKLQRRMRDLAATQGLLRPVA
ncbi:MAG: RNA polymerase sigma factor RpoH [Rhodobacterales bacterium CG_4_10_14_0_8_um_filter_70_9]|nr:MAG: RNA polymerase sigma factor RpoH [Rhodobacterales bacterium CG_4_10_14_0_8_um_filter_70_9]